MVKKVLITGVNGFLGSALREHLMAKQSSFEVFGIDRDKSQPSRQINNANFRVGGHTHS